EAATRVSSSGQLLLRFPHESSEHLAEAVIDVPYDDSEAAPQLRDVTGNDNAMRKRLAVTLASGSG
ncbi:hypothetical protein, partial [Bradyrhizobium sp. CCBAU 65884]|uniref:hypothetical protein n=1 Tax=Bradyrhizobium sp. CCBAU 65884 TaxID=722477 RepID=UPI002304EDBF